jgi:hypothetical protein
MDASRTSDVKPRITDESENVKTWKLADIIKPRIMWRKDDGGKRSEYRE